MLQRIQGIGNRYGWGVVVAAAPYVNLMCVATVGLGCFVLCLLFSMFGIYPQPPSECWNPFSWVLYFLIFTCYAWWIWSMVIYQILIPVGMAWSVADLILARARGEGERAAGAAAGLTLTLLPLLIWLKANDAARHLISPVDLYHAFQNFVTYVAA